MGYTREGGRMELNGSVILISKLQLRLRACCFFWPDLALA